MHSTVPQPAGKAQDPDYRPDIDGLRAVAVLSVLGFHAFPRWIPGGYIGVDVFFVISGFLISTIIFDRLESKRFSYLDFYARRIRRIFPALIVVLAASLTVGWIVQFPDEFTLLGRHAAAGAAFVYNLLAWQEAGYFDPASERKPLLHLWSLGIEEQFYILWPFCLALLFAKPRALPAVVAGIVAGSFVLNVALVSQKPTAAFYLPVTRLWELGLGSMLAHLLRPGASWPGVTSLPASARNAMAVAGLGAIAVAALILHRQSPFPGWWALLPCGGALMLIISGPDSYVGRKLMSNRLMVYIGLISYPLYLWHWPLLSFAHISNYGTPPGEVRLILVATAFVLAALTYELVEKPIRFRGRVRERAIALAIVMTLVCVVGVQVLLGLIPSRFSTEQESYLAYFENTAPGYRYFTKYLAAYRDECNFYDFRRNAGRSEIAPDCYTPSTQQSVLIWGDSHAQQFYHGLKTTLPGEYSILQVGTSGCIPRVEQVQRAGYQHCNRANQAALEIVKRIRPQVVILAQVKQHDRTDWGAVARVLRSNGAGHVLLLGPVPQWKPELYKVIASRYWNGTPVRIASHLDHEVLTTDKVLKARYSGAADLTLVPLIERLCDSGGCIAYIGDRRDGIFTWDSGHLTPMASDYVARNVLAPALNRLMQSQTRGTQRALAASSLRTRR